MTQITLAALTCSRQGLGSVTRISRYMSGVLQARTGGVEGSMPTCEGKSRKGEAVCSPGRISDLRG